jgi:hypothetical protein
MEQKTEHIIRKNFSNFFGSFGYLFCFLQWLWVVMLYFSVVQSATLLISPNADKQVEQSPSFTFALPDSSEIIILVIVMTVMIAVTIYVLIKIPMSIVKTSNKIVHKTAETMTPIVIKAQHKKDTKRFHAKITSTLMLAIKLLLVVAPVMLTVASGLLEKQSIDYSIAMLIGGGLACFSAVFFAIQYSLANLLHVKASDLW